jgi:hypothetical protein
MADVSYLESIPNNVDLAGDKTLQRALENWQPRFLDWWRDMGPEGYLGVRGLSAHRHQRRLQGLGELRLCEDA